MVTSVLERRKSIYLHVSMRLSGNKSLFVLSRSDFKRWVGINRIGSWVGINRIGSWVGVNRNGTGGLLVLWPLMNMKATLSSFAF